MFNPSATVDCECSSNPALFRRLVNTLFDLKPQATAFEIIRETPSPAASGQTTQQLDASIERRFVTRSTFSF